MNLIFSLLSKEKNRRSNLNRRKANFQPSYCGNGKPQAQYEYLIRGGKMIFYSSVGEYFLLIRGGKMIFYSSVGEYLLIRGGNVKISKSFG